MKNGKKALVEVNETLDVAYIGISPTTPSTIGIDLDKDIVAHVDVKRRTVIGFSIVHWKEFKQKLYLKERAKESVRAINDYILKHYPTIPIPTSVFLCQRPSV